MKPVAVFLLALVASSCSTLVRPDPNADHGPPPVGTYREQALASFRFLEPVRDVEFFRPTKWAVLSSQVGPDGRRLMWYGWRVAFDVTGTNAFGGPARNTFAVLFVNDNIVAVYRRGYWTETQG